MPLGDKALPCPGHLDSRCSFEDSTCPPLLERASHLPHNRIQLHSCKVGREGPGWGCGAQISYLFILEVGCLLIIR